MDWLNLDYRKRVIEEIKSYENIQRKKNSMLREDVYKDRIKPYVKDYLEQTLGTSSIEMPIIHNINVQKKVVNETSIVYNEYVKREFQNLDETQTEVMGKIYEETHVSKEMAKANIALNNQDQCWLQVVPSEGEYKIRLFKPYQIDVIPNEINPEIADAFIISTHDQSYNFNTDLDNQKIADDADYRASLERYIVWTRQLNFMMNGLGEFIGNAPFEVEDESGLVYTNTDLVKSLLSEYNVMPFVEISRDKDFKYFINNGASLSDFTIQLNAMLSDIAQIVRMQGYAQAYMKGPAEALVNNVKVGPSYVLKLATDPSGQGQDMDFGFANPNSDIKGSMDVVTSLVSLYLSSVGVSASSITASGQSEKFNSGLDRLLALFEKFEMNRDDFGIFKKAESELFELLATWNNVLSKTTLLKDEYTCKEIDIEEAEILVTYKKPEAVQSEKDQLDSMQMKVELGLASRITNYMELNSCSRDQAVEALNQIDEDNGSQNQTI